MSETLLEKIVTKLAAQRDAKLTAVREEFERELASAKRFLSLINDTSDDGAPIQKKPEESNGTANRGYGWKSNLIRRAIDGTSGVFTMHDIFKRVHELDGTVRDEITLLAVSGFLWRWAEQGKLEIVKKGKGQRAARYRKCAPVPKPETEPVKEDS